MRDPLERMTLTAMTLTVLLTGLMVVVLSLVADRSVNIRTTYDCDPRSVYTVRECAPPRIWQVCDHGGDCGVVKVRP